MKHSNKTYNDLSKYNEKLSNKYTFDFPRKKVIEIFPEYIKKIFVLKCEYYSKLFSTSHTIAIQLFYCIHFEKVTVWETRSA